MEGDDETPPREHGDVALLKARIQAFIDAQGPRCLVRPVGARNATGIASPRVTMPRWRGVDLLRDLPLADTASLRISLLSEQVVFEALAPNSLSKQFASHRTHCNFPNKGTLVRGVVHRGQDG